MGARNRPKFEKKGGASISKQKLIKPIDGFAGVSDADVLSRGTNVQTCMTGNANFPAPPVDLATFKAALETFSALIAS